MRASTASLQIEPTLPGLDPAALDHAYRLHTAGQGYLFLASKATGKRWREHAVTVGEIADRLRRLPPVDLYITQSRFHHRRSLYSLRETAALWTDIDYYRKPQLADRSAEEVAEMALIELEDQRLPAPQVIIASGRGLQLLWLHAPIEISEKPRWDRCQQVLHKALRDIGSDRATLPATSFLRLPGSLHSGSGQRVRVLQETPEVWDWDSLFLEVTGTTGIESATDTGHLLHYELEAAKRGRSGIFAAQGWSSRTLWAGRYQDLQTLRRNRWPRGVPVGQRDTFVWLSTVALSWIVPPGELEREASRLGRECLGHFEREALQCVKTTIRRAIRADRGERLDWLGQAIDPRYRFKRETLVELLEVSDSECRELKHIVTDTIRRDRRAERERLQRRDAGTETRQQNASPGWEEIGISRRHYYRLQSTGTLPSPPIQGHTE